MAKKESTGIFSVFKGLFGSYKRALVILIVLGFLGGILESLGVSILVPLFAHILQQDTGATGTIVKVFDWFFHLFGLETRLRVILPFLIIAFVLRAVVQWFFEYVRNSITMDYERNTRRDLYRLLLSADWMFLIKQKLGHSENEMMNGVNQTTKLLTNIAMSILNLTSLLSYVAVAFAISWEVTVLTVVVGGVVLYMFRPFLVRTRRFGTGMVDIGKRLAHDINESVLGLKSIKASGKERAVGDYILSIFDTYKQMRFKQAMASAVTNVTVQPISVIFVVAIFAYAFNRPGFDLASFVVVIFLIQRIFLYVDRAQATLQEVNQQIPYAASVVRFMKVYGEHKEKEEGKDNFNLAHSIEFKDVSFTYRTDAHTLSGINLKVSKGETVGIIGPSGAGKTTVADLFLRLLHPTSGSILVDGKPVEHIRLSSWREHVGYCSQEFFILNDTVYNNVRFYDERVGEEDVERAIKMVGLEDVVKKLPFGMHTSIGERGLELSAGQRQRVALARVLARKPSLLILDEATSALDGESEKAIHEALTALHGSMTIIIIAHRLTTVMTTDRLLVVEKGSIAEEGSPQELLKNENSYFYRLTHLQS
jgi:ATP-binding cassette subfamily C protein